MPANDFAPGNAKGYWLRPATLKKLLVRVSCDATQFDCRETDTERVYTLKNTTDSTDIPAEPESIEFYCWSNGVTSTIKLALIEGPTAIT